MDIWRRSGCFCSCCWFYRGFSDFGMEGASEGGGKSSKGVVRQTLFECLNGIPSSLALTKLLRNFWEEWGCSQELHGESLWQTNTGQENHRLLVNWRVGAGNGEMSLIRLTWNNLLVLAITDIKCGETACVKPWCLLVSPATFPTSSS